MNKTLRRFAGCLLLLVASVATARDPNFYVFLCLGQSNMEGFPGIPSEEKTFDDARFQVLAAVDFPALGRERGRWYTAVPPLCRPDTGLSRIDYFGRTMIASLPARYRVGVVNVAVAGTRIEVFDPEARAAYVATAPDWMKAPLAQYGGDPYHCFVEMGRLAQQVGVIKGILLHQGESNANDPAWPAKVKALYERLLADLDLNAADVPLLAGEVVAADQQGVAAGMNAIIARLPESVPTAHIIRADGCAALPDRLHFAPAGYRELGRRYAVTMLGLLEGALAASP